MLSSSQRKRVKATYSNIFNNKTRRCLLQNLPSYKLAYELVLNNRKRSKLKRPKTRHLKFDDIENNNLSYQSHINRVLAIHSPLDEEIINNLCDPLFGLEASTYLSSAEQTTWCKGSLAFYSACFITFVCTALHAYFDLISKDINEEKFTSLS